MNIELVDFQTMIIKPKIEVDTYNLLVISYYKNNNNILN